MNAIIVTVGIVVLLVVAVGVGMSMDTRAQRRAAERVAQERHMLAQQRNASDASHLCPGCPRRFLT